jgi:hypothetical protein
MRNKPDFSAPDGGNTTVDLGSTLNLEVGESPVFPNFFGTSAAAPHAGGIAALLIEGSQKFRGTAIAPAEIKSILQSTAIDMATPGFRQYLGRWFHPGRPGDAYVRFTNADTVIPYIARWNYRSDADNVYVNVNR